MKRKRRFTSLMSVFSLFVLFYFFMILLQDVTQQGSLLLSREEADQKQLNRYSSIERVEGMLAENISYEKETMFERIEASVTIESIAIESINVSISNESLTPILDSLTSKEYKFDAYSSSDITLTVTSDVASHFYVHIYKNDYELYPRTLVANGEMITIPGASLYNPADPSSAHHYGQYTIEIETDGITDLGSMEPTFNYAQIMSKDIWLVVKENSKEQFQRNIMITNQKGLPNTITIQ